MEIGVRRVFQKDPEKAQYAVSKDYWALWAWKLEFIGSSRRIQGFMQCPKMAWYTQKACMEPEKRTLSLVYDIPK